MKTENIQKTGKNLKRRMRKGRILLACMIACISIALQGQTTIGSGTGDVDVYVTGGGDAGSLPNFGKMV